MLTPSGTADPGRRRGPGGYTTVEVIFALFILGAAIAAVTKLYQTFDRMLAQMDEKNRIHRVLVFTMEQVSANLRQTRSVTRLGPVTVTGPVTIGKCVYPNGTSVRTVMPWQTVHLSPENNRVFAFKIPHMREPLNSRYDTTLLYYLKRENPVIAGRPVTVYKLYQQMIYFDNVQTEAFPALALNDRYRQEPGLVGAVPGATPEPTAFIPPMPAATRTPTPTPTPAASPTPVARTDIGRMAGAYLWKDLSFDDVSFYYDPENATISVGMVVSVRSKSLSRLFNPYQRRQATLSTTIAIRRTGEEDLCP